MRFLSFGALSLVACVSDAPLPVSDAGGDTGNNPTDAMGDMTASDAGPPMYTCGVIANSTMKIADATGLDGGDNKFDAERFALIKLSDGKTLAVVAVQSLMNQNIAHLRVFTFDSTQGSPGVTTKPPMPVYNRVIKIQRISDGIGVLVFEPKPNPGPIGFSIYKHTDQDALVQNNASLLLSRRVDIPTQTLNQSDSHSFISLGTDDYFLVGEANDGSTRKMVASRMNGPNPPVTEIATGAFSSFPHGMIVVGQEVHHFEGLGGFPMLSPGDRIFNVADAKEAKMRIPMDKHLMVAVKDVPGGYAIAAGEADWPGAGMLAGLRAGTVNSLTALDPTKLPLIPLVQSDLPFGGGDIGWFSFQSQPAAFVMAGQPSTGGGINFVWVDSNGLLRAKQTGATQLLKNLTNAPAAGIQPLGIPAPILARWGLAYIERTNQGDTIWYSQIHCNQ